MNIFCVVRNYAPHAAEMKSPLPAEPTFFEKPHTALLPSPATLTYPPFTNDLQHEIEIVVKIEKSGSHIPCSDAHLYYNSVALGIDLTARDIQRGFKASGMPWLLSKGFDGSAIVSQFLPLEEVHKSINDLCFSLCVNGKTVQEGCSSAMLYKVDEIISYISQYFTLKTGDLLYTGCPTGCGPVNIDDHLEGYLEERKVLDFYCK